MMKRRKTAAFLALVILLSSVFAACSAEDGAGMVAKVTTLKGPLKMRAKASSRGRVIASIPNGSCLLVLEEDEKWCLCRWNEKTGYCGTESLPMLREAEPGLLDYRVLRQGDRGEDVLALKRRLQDLGYIRSGSVLTRSEAEADTQTGAGCATWRKCTTTCSRSG